MSKQNEYLDNAAQTLELALRAANSSERSHRLNLADKWLGLADRCQQRPKASARELNEHPLVKRTFVGFRPETE